MIAYKGRKFVVETGDVRFPDGTEHHLEIVRHPPVAVLVPMMGDGRVVLVRQYRATIARHTWELPAGGLNPGETAEQAAARECEEETRLAPGSLERLCAFYPSPGFCDEEMIFFRATKLRQPAADSPHKPDEDEDIRVQAFTIADAKALVERGEIVDLKTAYGLTLI